MDSHNQHSWDHARWSVMWRHPKKKEFVVKEFDYDFVSARDFYAKVLNTERKMVTLHCDNVATPPPDEIRERMEELNLKGIWWCPYCMELRYFRKFPGYDSMVSGTYVDLETYECPVCEIPHRNGHVMKYNPIARRIARGKRTRGRKSKGGKRRRK